MSENSVKNLLKNCRNGIQSGDFVMAEEMAKLVLKKNPNNYMAHIYLGFVNNERNNRDETLKFYLKAYDLDPKQTLALYGLAKFYTICTDMDSKRKLLRIYQDILLLENQPNKVDEICTKLTYTANDIGEQQSIIDFLLNNCIETSASPQTDENMPTYWFAIANLIAKMAQVPPQLSKTFETAIRESLQVKLFVSFELYQKYIRILYKNENFDELLRTTIEMSDKFRASAYPLEWFVKVFVERTIADSTMPVQYSDVFHSQIVPALKTLNADSLYLQFYAAFEKFRDQQFSEARNLLENLLVAKFASIFCWLLLLESLNKLYCFEQSRKIAKKLLKSQMLCDLSTTVCDRFILAISMSGAEEIIEFVKTVESNISERTILLNIAIANESVTRAMLDHVDKPETRIILEIQIDRQEQYFNVALEKVDELLTTAESSCMMDAYYQKGLIYWDMKKYDLALIPFIKAAKCNQSCYLNYYYLGRIYELKNDIEKAKRCLQKAVSLNPYSIAIGIVLSRIYRQSKNWSQNLALLEFYTNGHAKYLDDETDQRVDLLWAWRQLGLHYLEKQEIDLATENFHKILRINPKNSETLESLADAYLVRESYTSALKSYELAAQITQQSIYSFLQIGFIKLKLHEYDEAFAYFEFVLERDAKYVPALKGAAETSLKQAQLEFDAQMLGRSQQKVQQAIDFIMSALNENTKYQCLWKIAADCCMFGTKFSSEKVTFYLNETVAVTLTAIDNALSPLKLTKNNLFERAVQFYSRAINLNNQNFHLWHDLALCYFEYANYLRNSATTTDTRNLLDRSLKIAKFCVKSMPEVSTFWNSLGVISTSEDIKDYGLAQHSFIKAVETDPSSAMAWSNLGVLYMSVHEVKLANEAFTRAQCTDPGFVNCWIGQALLAEQLKRDEQLDLFRHCTQLGFHTESAIGYAIAVCEKLQTLNADTIVYSIHNMNAVQVAFDNLSWYLELIPDNPIAWNLFGVLCEHQKNPKKARKCYRKSEELLRASSASADEHCLRAVATNCARIACILGDFKESLNYYEQIDSLDTVEFASENDRIHRMYIRLGHAFVRMKTNDDSFAQQLYESVIEYFYDATRDRVRFEAVESEICVVLAGACYRAGLLADAETYLLKSTEFQPSSVQGLLASCALGLLTGNFELARLVIVELEQIAHDGREIVDYPILSAYTEFLENGDNSNAVNALISGFYNYPYSGTLLVAMATFCYRVHEPKLISFGISCAMMAVQVDRDSIDMGFCSRLLSQLFLSIDNIEMALIHAQKAILFYPNCKKNWRNLYAILREDSHEQRSKCCKA